MEDNQNIEDKTRPPEIIRDPEKATISISENIDSQPQPPSKDMEVHSHSHTPRKKWSHYFWEFLMLFLAVFCGFLAEYKLEHVIENQREETLMLSLIDDLKADEKTLNNYFNWRLEVNQDFDALLLLLSKPESGDNSFLIYEKSKATSLRFGVPDIHEGTIQQLKNAGGLRLVRNKPVLNSINKHYLSIARMKSTYEIEVLVRVKLAELMSDVLDANQVINKNTPPESFRLVTYEKTKINGLMNSILAAKQINQRLKTHIDSAKISTVKLRTLIENEYHFQ